MLNLKEHTHHDLQTSDNLLRDVFAQNQPQVIRGLVSKWPAVQNNTNIVDYLKQRSANKPVQVMQCLNKYKGRYFYNEDMTGFNFTRTRMSFNEFLNALWESCQIQQSDHLYLGSTAIDHIAPTFRVDNDIPSLTTAPLISLWMGNQSRIAAHYDATHNLACVISGQRTFTLFAPQQAKNLYIGPIDFTPAGQPASLVDFEQVDYARFPLFKEAMANAYEVVLEPGDALYIPSMWWHHVAGQGKLNTMLNYWWRDAPMFAASPMDAMQHAILSIRDLPFEQRQIWREIFDFYIFNPDPLDHILPEHKGMLNKLDEQSARSIRSLLINKLNR